MLIIDVRIIFFLFFYSLDNHIPGPNAYKSNSLIGHNIYNSKYRSPSFVSMSQRFKIVDRNEKNPGPGSYIRFSEFGILAPKKIEKPKEEKKNENSVNKTDN